ncbi:hypothetical protein SAMN04488074_101898 [Lentzea albidocapillata subsp. violacea]|uniref:Uncharacterized protein n=1 Tax=Lentzea albidocapillata subsp. violacea TaxID=128104 RepID=A0A1G8S970_9PSEU|nr:hypothetical protein SAMN04488074_101898 [Lentzea albidocapillata subsp. violacea]
MTVVSDSAPAMLREYYRILTGGIEHYGDGRDSVSDARHL